MAGTHKIAMMGLIALFISVLNGCDKGPPPVDEGAKDLTRAATSVEDGMILLDYPGPKAQLSRRDGTVEYYCDTSGLLVALHDPDRAPGIAKAYVRNFDDREWGSYADGWITASSAVYVIGGRRMGAMGPTLVPFLHRAKADAFAAKNGGHVLAFNEITPQVMAEHARRASKPFARNGARPRNGGHSAPYG